MVAANLKSVLVVEDDPGVASLQARRLERAGYHVLTAGTVAEALAHVHQCPVQLIVMDFRLPGGVTGLDLHAQLRAAGFEIPVIIVTGFSDESTAIRSLRAGVRDFVSKSVAYLDYLPEAVERVLNEVRLEEAQREQAALLENAQDAIVVCDLERRIVYWNPRAERLYGWSADEAAGRPVQEVFRRDGSPGVDEARAVVEANGEWAGELEHQTRDGREISVESRWTLVRDAAARPKSILIVNTDVTEKKALESQLRHAQRLESIGALAGGVAHEFNNLLQAIGGYTAFAKDALPHGHAARADLEEVEKAAERAASLTRQLLSFGRRQKLERCDLGGNEVVAELLKMIRPLIGAHIEVRTELAEDAGVVRADPALLQQALLNLCINARDAMPDGGRLTLRTQSVTLDRAWCASHPDLKPGRYLRITIADTGCGMTPEVQARVFEPFFTTKGVGRGTGLGLSMVYGVVQQHGGTIRFESEPNRGTEFQIDLPMVAAPRAAARLAAPAEPMGGIASQWPQRPETILVADDDPAVRDVAMRVLRSAGYAVLAAADGAEAVEVFQEQAEAIDLVVLDAVMPRLTGHAAYERIRTLRPKVAVIISSGHDPDGELTGFIARSGLRLVPKPYDPQTLLAAVREALPGPVRLFDVGLRNRLVSLERQDEHAVR
ncbi:MAG: response regulator [Planctomycetes bacterium]|nr:response regulator [Planctomycetota bacterium]